MRLVQFPSGHGAISFDVREFRAVVPFKDGSKVLLKGKDGEALLTKATPEEVTEAVRQAVAELETAKREAGN